MHNRWVNITARLVEGIAREVDLDNPWVDRYRVPMTRDLQAGGYPYIATLVQPRPERENLWGYLPVEEADAALVGAYIAFRKRSLYDPYLREVSQWRVDLDPGVNTVSFARMAHGWVYRRFSWRDQPFAPYRDAEQQYPTLLDLINNERAFGGVPSKAWTAYLAEIGDPAQLVVTTA